MGLSGARSGDKKEDSRAVTRGGGGVTCHEASAVVWDSVRVELG